MIVWASAGEAKRTFALRLEIGIRNQIFLEKPEVGILIPINWFDSCNDSFLACMKLTLHKSRVHSCSVMHSWACSSLMSPPLPAEVGCESREWIVLLFIFIAWDCWTQTSWQLMQRDCDTLIAVSHVHLYFVKRSTSESVAMLQQV